MSSKAVKMAKIIVSIVHVNFDRDGTEFTPGALIFRGKYFSPSDREGLNFFLFAAY